jgi:hypothetical protein
VTALKREQNSRYRLNNGLTGEFVHDSGTVRGGRISGSVHGNEVSFSRDNGERRLQYKSILESPKKMNGSVSVEGIVCNFTAAKR